MRGWLGLWEMSAMTFIHAVILGDLIIFITYLYRKNSEFTGKGEVKIILFAYFLCAIRLAFPVDFRFSHGIPLRGGYSVITDLLHKRFIYKGILFPSIDFLLLCFWLVIAFIKFIILTMNYMCFWKKIKYAKAYDSEQIERVKEKVTRIIGKEVRFYAILFSEMKAPVAVGVRRKKHVIILSDKFSDDELFYILLHELTHLISGDLCIKFMGEILGCIFWWNPVYRYLQKDMGQLLEIKCDLNVANKLDKKETKRYLSIILENFKRCNMRGKITTSNKIGKISVGLFSENKGGGTKERFKTIYNCKMNIKKHRRNKLILVVLVFIVFQSSYLFIPIPSYEAPIADIEEDGAEFLNPDKSYIIRRNGKYFMQVNGEREEVLPKRVAEQYIEWGMFKIKYEEN
ncbi:MAG: M56 family metallopeptidase [Blautia sp.]